MTWQACLLGDLAGVVVDLATVNYEGIYPPVKLYAATGPAPTSTCYVQPWPPSRRSCQAVTRLMKSAQVVHVGSLVCKLIDYGRDVAIPNF